MRITCDRCGKDRMLNEVHTPARQREMPLRDIIARMRHDGCGGRAGRVELLTGIGGPRRGALPWLNPTGVWVGRGTWMAQAWSLHQHGHRAVGDEQSSGEQKKETATTTRPVTRAKLVGSRPAASIMRTACHVRPAASAKLSTPRAVCIRASSAAVHRPGVGLTDE